MSNTILIAGPTGLIGNTALHKALTDQRYTRVIALTRRPLGIANAKLEEWVGEDLLASLKPQRVDAVLCCLGTTISNVGGDKQKFIHVDKDLVVGIARWAQAQGVPVFCVVSAIGADADSGVFYNRVKGEMERDLKSLGLPTLHIFHPSILTGPRKELRRGERIGIFLGRLFSPLLPAKYKPMPHDMLAQALLNATGIPVGGTHSYTAITEMAALKN